MSWRRSFPRQSDEQSAVNLLRTIILFLVCWFATLFPAAAEPLTISYFERQPYYFTNEGGRAGGLLVERTQAILDQAGIEAKFFSLTPYRILYVLQHASVPHCSIGWLKKPERELYAKFSAPIYRNRALVLLTRAEQQNKFSAFETLHEVFSDPQLKMARMAGFSYGHFVDELLEKQRPLSLYLTGEQGDLLQAVMQKKASYMLISPVEVDMLARLNGLTPDKIATIELQDIPAGNIRYLMCNQAVPDELMKRMNKAIGKLFPELAGE